MAGQELRAIWRAAPALLPVLLSSTALTLAGAIWAGPALADCSTNAPASGATVTCDASAPNPETGGVVAPTSDGVTVNILTGAGLTNPSGPAIELRGGSVVNVGGHVDAGIAEAILFDPTPIASSTVGDDIDAVRAAVTVRKAQLADLAQQAITDYADHVSIDTTPQPLPSYSGGVPGNSDDRNEVTISGGLPGDGTVAGTMGSPDGVSTYVEIDDGTLTTTGDDTPGFASGAESAAQLYVHDGGLVQTTGDNAAGLTVGSGSGTAMFVVGGSTVRTTGDGSAAIAVNATDSVFMFASRGDGGGSATPLIQTLGDSAAGIAFTGGTGGTATLDISGPNTVLSTAGTNSSVIDFATTGGSSFSTYIERSTLTTGGDGSNVINMTAGENSDGLLVLQDVTVQSGGENSDAVHLEVGANSSVEEFIATGSSFETTGNGSAGIYVRGAYDTSSVSIFAAANTIVTHGDNAAGFATVTNGQVAGDSSVQSMFLDDTTIETFGDNSPGFHGAHLDRGSAEDESLTNFDIKTHGANSGGIVFDGYSGDGSAWAASLGDGTIVTDGDGSLGIDLGGSYGGDSLADLDVSGVEVSTSGDDATGFRIATLPTDASFTNVTMDGLTVHTLGDRSVGLAVGSIDPLSLNSTAVRQASTLNMALHGLDVITEGDDATGVFLEGLRDGTVSSQQTVTLSAFDIETSGERSDGLVLGGNMGRTFGSYDTGFTSVLSISDMTVNTSGANANALVIGANTNLTDDPDRIGETAPDGSIIDGQVDTFDTFTASGDGGRSVQNYGTIDGGSTGVVLGSGIRGNFANAGTITAEGPYALTYDVGASIDDVFELQPGGVVVGKVLAGLGTDSFILGGVGTDSFDVGLLDADGAADGDDQYLDFESFVKEDASTWTLTGSNAEIDTFALNGGKLLVDGTLANASVPIADGGILGGHGTIGSFTAMSGGSVAPGNSIGTLHVAGTANFADGSFYDVEVNAAGDADLIVAGDAVLDPGAVVRVAAAPGGYATATTYTILTTTDDPLGGAFDPAPVVNLAFLDGSLSYDDNNVYLTLTRNLTDFADLALTPNQRATGVVLDAMDLAGSDLPYDELIGLTTDEVPGALDALSGEGHADLKEALVEESGAVREAVFDRVAADFAALEEAGLLKDSSGTDDEPGALVWGHLYGSQGTIASDGNADRTAFSAGGFLIGADRQVSDRLRLGLLVGAGQGAVSARGPDASSTDLTIGGYGGASLGIVDVAFGAALTHHEITTGRAISFPGVDDRAEAEYGADTLQVFAEVSRSFAVGEATLTPFADVALVSHHTGGFTETGADGALDGAADTINAAFTTFGIRAGQSFVLGDGHVIRAEGSVAWRHAFAGDVTATNSFAGGTPFTVAAAPIAEDTLEVGGKLSLDLADEMNLEVAYDGRFGDGLGSNAVKLTLAGRF